MVTYAKLSPKMVNPRVIAGNAEEDHIVSSDLWMLGNPLSQCLMLCCSLPPELGAHMNLFGSKQLGCRLRYGAGPLNVLRNVLFRTASPSLLKCFLDPQCPVHRWKMMVLGPLCRTLIWFYCGSYLLLPIGR